MKDRDLNQTSSEGEEENEEHFSEWVELPIEDVLDLHTFSPKEVRNLVEDYIQQAYEAGLTRVRIIHGKGKGVQRNIVHSVLTKSPYIRGIETAPPEFGGWGATIAYLGPANSTSE